MAGWRILAVLGVVMALGACSTYPSEPRYPIRPTTPGAYPDAQPPASRNPYDTRPYETIETAPPPPTAPIAPIEGGALPPSTAPVYAPPPAPVAGPVRPGAAYTIVAGDTISGVGRRFQTPVQILIDLNGLGPRGAITPGQRIILPDSAVDGGHDPYATGASPVGVIVPEGATPPPPPPPSVAPPPRPAPSLPSPAPATPPAATGAAAMDWPVRGDIVRRFGPVGMGERNNGINIGASAGAAVRAAAAGRVAYVGDDLPGQGLTVLILHADGWRTVYGHLGSATVEDGDQVRQGQQIGTVGLTAGDGRPSMHFETRRMQGDQPLAIDPLTVLPR